MIRIILFCLFLLSSFTATYAQTTTASLAGRVTSSADSSPLPGATVVATHIPSATIYGAIADSDGSYRIDGMRVGGPYSVEISFVGSVPMLSNDIQLPLGYTHVLNASLETSQSIEQVTVSVTALKANLSGASSNFNREQIEALPTLSRSLNDVTRLSPMAMAQQEGGLSISGANPRFNSFQIDGIASNDLYGLTSGGTNGGLANANPIPLDAIDAVQVVVAPFDVRESGFTGGGINAVTKSGTNTFKGTAYGYYNDNNFYGKGVNMAPLAKQMTQIYGVSLGGAIIKNRLFFFVNGEFNLDRSPSAYYVGTPECNITEQEAQSVSQHFYSLTGYDGGGYGRRNVERRSTSLLARLDWTISKGSTLTVRYNYLNAGKEEYNNYASAFYFNGSGYTSPNQTHSLVGELNSRISKEVFNSLRVGYQRVVDGRDSEARTPSVLISKAGENGNTSIQIGTDPYCGMNELTQNSISIADHVSIYKQGHTITVGTHNEFFSAQNLYVSNALGTYTYNTVGDFLQGSPSMYQRSIPIGDPTIHMKTAQFGLYVQDEWRINRLSLTYGLRADVPVVFGTPRTNEAFNAAEVAQTHGIRTNQKPRSQVLLSPRIGVRWQLAEGDSYKALLRGGAGLFTGKVPFVWITNCYSNTGMTQRGYLLYGGSIPAFGQEPSGTEGVSANPMINIVDRDFRYPQVLRANIALEQSFGRGWNITIEGLFSKTLNDIYVRNLVAQRTGANLYAVSADAATSSNTTPYYDSSLKNHYSSIYYIQNTSKGYSYLLSASLSKYFDFGLNLSAAYTFSHSYSIYDGFSSSASSIWSKGYATTSDNAGLSWSVFDTPHKISASLTYTKRYGGNFGTTLSLIYQGYSGMRYSLTYYKNSVDVNGDSARGNSTLYIPTTDELAKMDFENESQRADFNAYIEGNRYLRTHRGEYSPRNVMQAPFEHHVDLHVAQDFYFGRNTERKVQITLDVMNLGNLLCRNWGAYYLLNDWKLSPMEVYALNDDGAGNKTPRYRWLGAELTKNDLLSRWRMQLGVRIVF